jgi:general secretion pathway protein G
MQKRRIKKRNFTLIEMVVVIVIIALLAAIVTPAYYNYIRKANVSAAKAQIKMLEQAIFDFRLDTGKLPDAASGLDELFRNTSGNEKWDGPYLKQAVPKDPWGNDYVYKKPGENTEFEIISYGSDGQPGGEKDKADISSAGTSAEK